MLGDLSVACILGQCERPFVMFQGFLEFVSLEIHHTKTHMGVQQNVVFVGFFGHFGCRGVGPYRCVGIIVRHVIFANLILGVCFAGGVVLR